MISVSLDLVLPEVLKIERKLHIERELDRKLLKKILDDGRMFFSPKYSYRHLGIDAEPVSALLSASVDLKEFLQGSEHVFVVICTIGDGFEKLADKYKFNGDVASLLFLDRIGSDTVENLAQYSSLKLLKQFYNGAKGAGYVLSRRYSPGYGDLPLQNQQILFSMFAGEGTEISINEAGFMKPEKSISYIVGVKNV